MEMEYADTMQETIAHIADHYHIDLNASDVVYRLESPDSQVLVIRNLGSHRISLTNRYKEDGNLKNGMEVVLFTGLKRWVPLWTTLSTGERIVSAEIDDEINDFDIVDWEGYGHLNRGCRYFAREYRGRYLTQADGVQARTISQGDAMITPAGPADSPEAAQSILT